jgi:large subunit ribosomal protein L21
MSTDLSDVYAVIRSGGKQYRVSPGQRIKLERLDGDAGDPITFDDVLLVNGGGEIAVGAPTVESARVNGEIVEQGRGRKINVFKYKNKTRYRRLRGHRQLQTSVLVNEVALGDQTWTAPVKEQPVAEEPSQDPVNEEPAESVATDQPAASEDSGE